MNPLTRRLEQLAQYKIPVMNVEHATLEELPLGVRYPLDAEGSVIEVIESEPQYTGSMTWRTDQREPCKAAMYHVLAQALGSDSAVETAINQFVKTHADSSFIRKKSHARENPDLFAQTHHLIDNANKKTYMFWLPHQDYF